MISNGPFLIHHRGHEYEVSALFHAENVARWPWLSLVPRDDLYQDILSVLRTSEHRALTQDERALLDARVRHYNVRSAIDFLDGRSVADFGMAYVDQAHGMRGTFACGCCLQFVFDHYLARALASEATPELIVNGMTELAVYPHYPRSVCDKHAHLAEDMAALHEAVRGDAAEEGVLTSAEANG